MTDSYDTIVIGAGLIGLSTAISEAARGSRVLVVEQDNPGKHASGVNVGGVRLIGRDPAEFELSEIAKSLWRAGDGALGNSEFCPNGHLIMAETEAEVVIVESRMDQLARAGLGSHARIITREEIVERIPLVGSTVLAGLFSDSDGMADVSRTVAAHVENAGELGVELRIGCAVTGLEWTGNGWVVELRTGEVRGTCVVNAAGAWGSKIADLAGDKLQLQVEAPIASRTIPVPTFLGPVVQAIGRKLTLKQLGDGHLLVGGGHRATPALNNRTVVVPEEEVAGNLDTVNHFFPNCGSLSVEHAWAGLEGYTPDRVPYIGRSGRYDSLFHAFGFSGHGFQLAPAVGRTISNLIDMGAAGADLEPFSPSRFEEKGEAPEDEILVG